MGISINEITRGVALKINEGIWVVTTYSHVKPGKGSAFVRVNLRNVQTQQVLERTYKSSERLEDVALEERKLQTLYKTDDSVHFMDMVSFEEITISTALIGDDIRFLQDNLQVTGFSHGSQMLTIELPNFITTEITHTEPGIKGDSSRSGNKPATIDTGAVIQVPLFIDTGDKIRLDTRSGSYVERVR